MDLIVRRKPTTDGATLGQLFVNGKFECFTLEDAIRTGPKLAHETAIPAGTYEVTINRSKRFGRMLPLVLDVPGFTGIRIHPGNTTADTSGCILVGLNVGVDSIVQSRLAMEALQPKIAVAIAKGDKVRLVVMDPDWAPTVRA